MRKLPLCALAFFALQLISFASTKQPLRPIAASRESGINQLWYGPHREVFRMLVPGMSGENARRIIEASAAFHDGTVNANEIPPVIQLSWDWHTSFYEADGIAWLRSTLMVSIENGELTVIILKSNGVYRGRPFKSTEFKVIDPREKQSKISGD